MKIHSFTVTFYVVVPPDVESTEVEEDLWEHLAECDLGTWFSTRESAEMWMEELQS